MKIQKSAGIVGCLVAITVFIAVCNNETKPVASKGIKPVNLPILVPGFSFPADSNTIYGWMNNTAYRYNYDSTSVYNHAWGIWAGLTAQSGQVFANDSLRIYETWLGITDVQSQMINGRKTCDGATKDMRAALSAPHQFGHGLSAINRRALLTTQGSSISDPISFWVTVAYNPDATCYAFTNQILKQSVLDTYSKPGGIGNIPAFPNNAITIKPSYFVGQANNGLIRIPVWPGPPPTPQGYGPNAWNKCVYADVSNKQPTNKIAVPADTTNLSPDVVAAATVNLNDFIHFAVDQQMANHMNRADSTEGLQGSGRAVAGEIAILVAMHVATKEISNWTWQTYYWAHNPANPDLPSSRLAASLRPSQLQGPASHYALATAYAMVLPNQPITGGTNTGVQPMLAYNPYLEAIFKGTTPDDPLGDFNMKSVLIPGKQFGVQTNCMSCHAMASESNKPGYTTDQYISLDTSIFINQVMLDFAWSIQGNMIKDGTTTPPPATKK